MSGSFGWAETNTQGRIFWQSGTGQLFAPFLLTAPSSKGDKWLSLFPPCAGYSQQSKSCSFFLSLHLQRLQWMSIWPCWYAGLQDGFAPFPLGPQDAFPICSTGVWKTTKCRKILHSLQSGCLGTGHVLLSLQSEGRWALPEDALLHSRKGFQGRWDDDVAYTTFSCPLCRASSEQTPHCQGLKSRSWTRIHLVLKRHNGVQPHRPTGCDTGSSGWVTAAMPWNAHREWPNQLTEAISHLALSTGQWLLTRLPELLGPFLSNHLALKAIFYSSVIVLSEGKSISRAVSISLLWFIFPFHICQAKQTQFSKYLCYPLAALPCKSVLVPEPGRKGKVSLMNPTSPSHPPTITYRLLPPISPELWQ